jgi:hypothetical protein
MTAKTFRRLGLVTCEEKESQRKLGLSKEHGLEDLPEQLRARSANLRDLGNDDKVMLDRGRVST